MKSKEKSPLMFKGEQKLLDFLGGHLYLLALIVITVIAIAVRVILLDYQSGDAYYFLLPWYETIKTEGFKALSHQVGDYNMLYQFLVAIFTLLPLKALHAYKLFTIIFDFLLAALAARIVYKNADDHHQLKAVIAYGCVLLSPLVIFNGALWAQCDAVYTFFCILSLYMMYKDRYLGSMILFGVAMAFKLQAIFILPILLFCYFRKKKFSILYFLICPAVMIFCSLPGLLQGRKITEVFTIYFSQTSTYKSMSMNYPSFWTLFQDKALDTEERFGMFSKIAVILTVALLIFYLLIWYKKKITLNYGNFFSISLLVVYTCVLFLPSMHERYGFLYEILALFVALKYYRTIPILLLTYSVSIMAYGLYLFTTPTNIIYISLMNLAAYAAYAIYLNRQILKNNDTDTTEIYRASAKLANTANKQK